MKPDHDRIALVKDALAEAHLDALLCSLPCHVLLLTGYWPVIGTSLALVTKDGQSTLLVPEDEGELAKGGWADDVVTFETASLDTLTSAAEAIPRPLRQAARRLGLGRARIGLDFGQQDVPVSYSSLYLYQDALRNALAGACPEAVAVPADDVTAGLAMVKTPSEIERLRRVCAVAAEAFDEGRRRLEPGMTEPEAAELFRAPLATRGIGRHGIQRAGGFTWAMSGPNAALAFGAYARSRSRRLRAGELVLVHCNSYADGFWTDLTRTYALGVPDERQLRLYEAVHAARASALAAIRPGVPAAQVDEAARSTLAARGLAQFFKHPTGHGVGFGAISPRARPQIHPKSRDVLAAGMVFNVEPALYFAGEAGLRHCDMVVVTPTGVDVLTPFQAEASDVVLRDATLALTSHDA